MNTQDSRSVDFNLFLVILPKFGFLVYTCLPDKPSYGTPLSGLPLLLQCLIRSMLYSLLKKASMNTNQTFCACQLSEAETKVCEASSV